MGIYISFFHNIPVSSPGYNIHLVIMSSQSSLDCDSLGFSLFYISWTVLNNTIEYPIDFPQFGFVGCLLYDETVIKVWEKNTTKIKCPFHCIISRAYHLVKVKFLGFYIVKCLFFPFPILFFESKSLNVTYSDPALMLGKD